MRAASWPKIRLCSGLHLITSGYMRPKPSTSEDKDARHLHGDPVPTLLTIAEACAVLKVSKWTLYQLMRSRQLNSIRIRRRRFIPASELQALVGRLRNEEAA